MASKLDHREVLAYLNELGYRNITAKQLKDFMRDLKKLITYEERYSLENIENIPPEFPYNENVSLEVSVPLEFKRRKNKKGIVSLEIKNAMPTCHCVNHNENKLQSLDSHVSTISQSDSDTVRQKAYLRQSEVTSSREPSETSSSRSKDLIPGIGSLSRSRVRSLSTSPRRTKSCEPTVAKSKATIKLKGHMKYNASFILPREPVRNFKSDPVALYYKYQRGWQKLHIPGESSHSQLRWAIRGYMLGQSSASSTDVISRRSRIAR